MPDMSISELEARVAERERQGFKRTIIWSAVPIIAAIAFLGVTIWAIDQARERLGETRVLLEEGDKQLAEKAIDLANTEATLQARSQDLQALESEIAKQSAKVEELKATLAGLEERPDETNAQQIESLPPRVYFHIVAEEDRIHADALAASLESRMSSLSLVVPGIERVDPGFSGDQLRFFKQDEEPLARQIASVLETLGQPVEVIPLWQRYGDSPNIRPRHFELWLDDTDTPELLAGTRRVELVGVPLVRVFESGDAAVPIDGEDEMLRQALASAAELGVSTPLGQTVLLDTLVQMGRARLRALSTATSDALGGDPSSGLSEEDWITDFLDERQLTGGRIVSHRVDALLKLADDGNWALDGDVLAAASGETRSPAGGLCEKYGSTQYDSSRWARDFIRPIRPGTWHVFVSTLASGLTEAQANRVAADFAKRFPQHSFAAMPTVSADNANQRYAIVIAQGLEDESVAREIATYADSCGVASGAYAYRQQR